MRTKKRSSFFRPASCLFSYLFGTSTSLHDTTKEHLQRSVKSDNIIEPVHEISNNVVCATSKASDQPAHTCSLIRAFACRLSIL